MTSESKRSQKPNNLFPPMATLSEAQKVARMGAWAACFVAGLTALLAIAAIAKILPPGLPVNGWALIDAAIFGGVAWGIYRMSRIAAVVGLVLYIVEQIYTQVASGGKPGAVVVMVVIILAFINGIRGTFAYHRMQKASADSL